MVAHPVPGGTLVEIKIMAKKLKTNTDLIVDLMERSPHGALCQAFIIQAVETFALRVARSNPDEYKHGPVHPAAWCGIGKDIAKRMAAFYGRPAPVMVGDKFVNVEDEIDNEENDEERITPAGSVWIVTSIHAQAHVDVFTIACEATGGSINPTEEDLLNPQLFVRVVG